MSDTDPEGIERWEELFAEMEKQTTEEQEQIMEIVEFAERCDKLAEFAEGLDKRYEQPHLVR